MNQKIQELSDRERKWIAAQLAAASMFVETWSPPDAGKSLTLAGLDRAFAAWLATNEKDSELVNGAINCVGIAFGQSLVDGAGMAWVIVTDQYGTELAVHALPKRGDVLVCPANFVAKRWERRETNFLEDSYGQITSQIDAIKQEWSTKRDSKPWWKPW